MAVKERGQGVKGPKGQGKNIKQLLRAVGRWQVLVLNLFA